MPSMIVEAKYTADGRPEFDAADFKEMEAVSRGPDVLTAQEETLGSVGEELALVEALSRASPPSS